MQEAIAIDTTLTGGLEFVRQSLQAVAMHKAAQLYPKGSEPVVVVDKARGKPIENVKPFGEIVFLPSLAPIKEAVDLAWRVIEGNAPRASGHYRNSFVWYFNGQPVGRGGPPAGIEKIGRKGNVEIADLAPYATMAEIQVPTGVMYAAFFAVWRRFGQRVRVRFGYRRPEGAYTPNDGGPYDYARTYPLNVPYLEIGAPGSNVRQGASKPGSAAGKKRHDSRVKRAALKRAKAHAAAKARTKERARRLAGRLVT